MSEKIIDEQLSFDDYLWNVNNNKINEKENYKPMSENMMPIAEANVGSISWQNQIEYLTNYTNQVVEKYDNLVFTDEEMPAAKKDRADLAGIVKEIDSVRMSIKKAWMKPYEEYEDKIKEQVNRVKGCREKIDLQIKDYETHIKDEKKERIEKWWKDNANSQISLSKVWDEKYLNLTCKDSEWQKDLKTKVEKISNDILAIMQFDNSDGKLDFCLKEYTDNVDLGITLANWERELNKRKLAEEYKAKMEEKKESKEDVKEVILEPQVSESDLIEELLYRTFKVEATKTQLLELGDYMKSKGIKFWLLKGEQ